MSLRNTLPALFLAGFALLCSLGMTLAPQAGAPVAVIFPPGITENTALAAVFAANADSLRGFGGWAGVVIAESKDPLFVQNLRRQGAWLVLRASPLTGCFTKGDPR